MIWLAAIGAFVVGVMLGFFMMALFVVGGRFDSPPRYLAGTDEKARETQLIDRLFEAYDELVVVDNLHNADFEDVDRLNDGSIEAIKILREVLEDRTGEKVA